MNKRMTLLLDFMNLIVSFFVCRWFFMEYMYFYSLSIFGLGSEFTDFVRSLAIVIVMTLVLFTIIRVFYSTNNNKYIISGLYVVYFFLLIYLLFFKSIGVQGANFDLFTFLYDSIMIDAKVPIFNVLMFVPLGMLTAIRYRRIFYFVICITVIEICQYIFHLGFFDIGDIFTNTIGFILGSALHESKLGKRVIQTIK